jgi:hypothetical protein
VVYNLVPQTPLLSSVDFPSLKPRRENPASGFLHRIRHRHCTVPRAWLIARARDTSAVRQSIAEELAADTRPKGGFLRRFTRKLPEHAIRRQLG